MRIFLASTDAPHAAFCNSATKGNSRTTPAEKPNGKRDAGLPLGAAVQAEVRRPPKERADNGLSHPLHADDDRLRIDPLPNMTLLI